MCSLMVFSADMYKGGVDKVDRTLCIYIHMLPTALVLNVAWVCVTELVVRNAPHRAVYRCV